MQTTTHYALKKPDGTDNYNVANDNANMDAIDAQMYANAQAAAAAQSTANAAIPSSQKGVANGVASLDATGKMPVTQIPSLAYIPTSAEGVANGVAVLDGNSQVPAANLKNANGIPYVVDTSNTANTVTASVTPSPTAYADGLAVCVKIANTSTGAATLNLNNLGAVAIHNGDGSAVGSGDLVAGVPVTLRYVGGASPAFIASGSGGLSGTGNATAADVLSPYTFTSASGKKQTGTMPENGGVVITPGPNDIAIPAGHHDGTGKVSAVTFDASKLLTGTTVAGTAGTMPNNGSPTLNPGQSLAAGYYSGGSVALPTSGSQTWNTPGTYTFTVPSGVTRIFAEVWGAGGGGGGGSGAAGAGTRGGGGGSGAWTCAFIDVTPNQQITVVVGSGGQGGMSVQSGTANAGQAGGSSSFGSVSSGGGSGGGAANDNTNGTGGAGAATPSYSGMLAGRSGGTGALSGATAPSSGGPALNGTSSIGAAGPTPTASLFSNSNAGGQGGASQSGTSNPAQNGGNPGGGGGGSQGEPTASCTPGGKGGDGAVLVKW